ncbi:MAG: hypothetical protein FXF47_00115 [Candidatus Mcinerneyibacterium aminivorans]|uniref:Uncharacterized protein n=1 Tax=Candidatus Mcinerneyibacterium aminivorans TaxID=2703815 RepID=A0A5D0MES9_9BACT|nr:MAG: hypothetical protein FXF47_00115 [Candidatus Mcinerneyibacterium aminivorans]
MDKNIDKEEAQRLIEEEDMNEKEVEDLIEEIEHFKKEKERVRSIVGNIGGMPSFNSRAFNIIFSIIVIGLLVASFIVVNERIHFILSDIAIAAISVKIIYLIYKQGRVNHFKLWILSSLEWKVNEISKKVKTLEKKVEDEEKESKK